MPRAPKQRCKSPGCRERQSGPRCARHELSSPRNHRGIPRQRRGLGADHDRNVKRVSGPCELRLLGCTGVATSPQHRIPRSRGGTNDPANIGGACRHCQNAEGAALARGAR